MIRPMLWRWRHVRLRRIGITVSILLLILLLLLLLLLLRMKMAAAATTAAAPNSHVPRIRRTNGARHIARTLVSRKRRVERIETHWAKTIARIRRRQRYATVTHVIAITRVICAREITAHVGVLEMLRFFSPPTIATFFVLFPPAVERISAHAHSGDDEKRCES
jgi:hypothetical protein